MNFFRHKAAKSVLLIAIFIFFIGSTVYAAEEAGNWRSTYDLVMRWVNFIILVAILVKFGKTPLKNMLAGEKSTLETEIKELEEERQQVEEKVSSAQKMLDESHIRFNKLTERIIKQGENKKRELIEDAKRESKVILNSTKRKLESQIIKAKESFRAELVDAAITSAFDKLPNMVKDEDHKHFFDTYLHSLEN